MIIIIRILLSFSEIPFDGFINNVRKGTVFNNFQKFIVSNSIGKKTSISFYNKKEKNTSAIDELSTKTSKK